MNRYQFDHLLIEQRAWPRLSRVAPILLGAALLLLAYLSLCWLAGGVL